MNDLYVVTMKHGRFAICDIADRHFVANYKWHYARRHHCEYAITGVTMPDGRRRAIGMHRVILAPGKHECSDHINGYGLDNRRCNLRVATHAENMRNGRKHKITATMYRGVFFDGGQSHQAKPWRSRITSHGKRVNIGRFKTEEEAALAYDKAAMKYHGQFARLNYENSPPLFRAGDLREEL